MNGPRPYGKPQPRRHARPGGPAQRGGWDPVAAWYDKLVGDGGSDYHRHVILPAALRLLAPGKGESILDLCCGQGVLLRPLLDAGVASITAVDASPRLIAAARARHGNPQRVSFHVADASRPGPWTRVPHDKAVCLMAVHDVADAAGLFHRMAEALKPGGRGVIVLLHPCFRIPRQSHWGWDEDRKIQYRRMDRYHSQADIPIITHPGQDGGGHTVFHHRPLDWYLNTLGAAGLAVSGCEELLTHRRSQPGPRSRGEHRAAEEFPVFLALVATRLP